MSIETIQVLEEVRREIDESPVPAKIRRVFPFEEARLMATEIISAKINALKKEQR